MSKKILLVVLVYFSACKTPDQDSKPSEQLLLNSEEIDQIIRSPLLDQKALTGADVSSEASSEVAWESAKSETESWVSELSALLNGGTKFPTHVVVNPGLTGFNKGHAIYLPGFYILFGEPEAYLWTICHELAHRVSDDTSWTMPALKQEALIDIKGGLICSAAGMNPKSYVYGMRRHQLALRNAIKLGWIPLSEEDARTFLDRIKVAERGLKTHVPADSALSQKLISRIPELRSQLLTNKDLSTVANSKGKVFEE